VAGPIIGDAAVRIRADTSGFKSETEAGVRSSFSSLAKIAGLAFGGAAVGELIKNSIESAGQTQAAAIAIADTYGRAGRAVQKFTETTGAHLGGLEASTQKTAVQLGQLFSRAGLSGEQASRMATGWEKLALAVNSIRGGGTSGAAQLLDLISHAAAGTSTRGLTALGISINASSIALQALRDGYIKFGQSAASLTPAQKQIVTYQLAVRQLPQLMDQAKAHSGDFANEQARLAVEWENAKSTLGGALLPIVTKYVTELANWLGKMEQSGRLQRDFNVAAHDAGVIVGALGSFISHATADIEGLVRALGGAKTALIILGSALAALKLHSIGGSVRGDVEGITGRIKARVAAVKQAADGERGAAGGASAAWAKAHDAITKSSEATKKSVVSTASAASGAWAKAHDDITKSVSSATTAATSGVGVAGTQAVRRVSVAGSDAAGAVMEAEAEIKAATQASTKTTVDSVAARGAAFDKYAARIEADNARIKAASAGPVVRDEEWYRKNIPSYVPGSLEKGRKKIQEDLQRALRQPTVRPLPPIVRRGLAGEEYGFGHVFTAQEQGWGKVEQKAKSAAGAISTANTRSANRVASAWGSATTRIRSGLGSIGAGVQQASGSFAGIGSKIEQSGQKSSAAFKNMGNSFSHFGSTIATRSEGFRGAISKASSGAATAFASATTVMGAASIELKNVIMSALASTAIGALVVAIGIAVTYIITHWSKVKAYTVALADAVIATWHGLKTTLLGIAEVIGGSLATSLTAPLRAFLEVASKVTGWLSFLPGVSGLHDKVNEALDFLKKGTTDLVTKGAHNVASGVTDIFNKARDAWNKALDNGVNDPKSKADAKKRGHDIAKNMLDGAQTSVTQLAPSVSKTISDALQNAVRSAHQAILASVRSAKDNLDKIGGDLAKTIEKIQEKIGGAAGGIAGSPQGQAFKKLKELIESGAPSFQIQKAANEVSGNLQQAASAQKSVVQQQLANLTASFNKGDISYKGFETRLNKILKENGITLKEALKAGGPAFAETFKAQVGALREQAKAISEVPKKFRGIGGAGGAADIKIIRPLEVIRVENQKIRVAQAHAAAEAQRQRAAILKAQQKELAVQQKAAAEGIKVKFVGPKPGGHHTDSTRAHVLLDQIRTHTRRTADELQNRTRARQQHRLSALEAQLKTALARSDTPRAAHIADEISALKRRLATTRTVTAPQFKPPAATTFDPVTRHLSLLRTGVTAVHQAIKTQQVTLLRGLREVCADVMQADKDIVAAELGLHTPIEGLRRTELRIGESASRQRERQIRAQHETNTLLRRLDRYKGPVPGFNKERPGTGGHHARKAAHAGVKV
jgi:hypothetical protein